MPCPQGGCLKNVIQWQSDEFPMDTRLNSLLGVLGQSAPRTLYMVIRNSMSLRRTDRKLQNRCTENQIRIKSFIC